EEFRRPLVPQETVVHNVYATMPAGFVAYLPQAASIRLAALLGAGPMHCFYAARLGNLLVAAVFLFLAVRLAPVGRGVLAAVILCPGCLGVSGSARPDALGSALTFLTFAYVARLALAPDVTYVSWRQVGVLVVLGVMLALCKYPWAALLLPLLAVPV